MKRLKIKIKGLNIDSTLNRLSKKTTTIKDLKRPNYEELEFVIDKKEYPEIKKYIEPYDYEIEDKSKKTFIRIFASLLAVWGVMPIILIFSIFASKFLWRIEINGLNNLTKQEILKVLKDNDIQRGKKIDKDTDVIEKALLTIDRIAQCSCHFEGTTLMINISEKLVYTPKVYEPIKADYNGFITSLNVKKGTVNCKVGDFVRVGDILVMPFIIDKNGNSISVNPEAEIEGKIYISQTSMLERYEKVLVKSGKIKKEIRVCFTNKQKNNISYLKPFVFYEIKVYNTCISSVLPIIRQRLVFYELIEQTITNDLTEKQQSNEQASKEMAYSLLEENVILEENTMSIIANDVLFSTTTLVYNGSIIKG